MLFFIKNYVILHLINKNMFLKFGFSEIIEYISTDKFKTRSYLFLSQMYRMGLVNRFLFWQTILLN